MENNLSIVKDQFKELPNNIEAEQAVIGSILVSNDIFDEISTIISSINFYDPMHQKIFEAIEERVIEQGDPYRWQVERTAQAVAREVGIADLDWGVCYQSRVGPLTWIGPSTVDELKRAGKDRVPVVVVPIAFVSEHSETLVELDIDYAELAAGAGVPHYVRAPTVGADVTFIAALADMAKNTGETGTGPAGVACGTEYADCPCLKAAT